MGRRQEDKDPKWVVASASWLFTKVFPGFSRLSLGGGGPYIGPTGLVLKPRGGNWSGSMVGGYWEHFGLNVTFAP